MWSFSTKGPGTRVACTAEKTLFNGMVSSVAGSSLPNVHGIATLIIFMEAILLPVTIATRW